MPIFMKTLSTPHFGNTSPLDEERDFARKTNQHAKELEELFVGNPANKKAIQKHQRQASQAKGISTMLGKTRLWKGLRNLSLGMGLLSTAASGFGFVSLASKPTEVASEKTQVSQLNEKPASNGTTLSIVLGTMGLLGALGFVGANKNKKKFEQHPQTQRDIETYQRHLQAIQFLATKSIVIQPYSMLSPSEQKLLRGLHLETTDQIKTYHDRLLELADPRKTSDPNLRAYLAKLFEVDLSTQSQERQKRQKELEQLNTEIAAKTIKRDTLINSKFFSGQFQLPDEGELYALMERQKLLEKQLSGDENVINIPPQSHFENLFKYLALVSFQDPILSPQSALASPNQPNDITELALMTRMYTFARLALSEGNLYQLLTPSNQNPHSQQGLHPDMIGLLQTHEQQVNTALKQRDETDNRIDTLQHGIEKAQKAYGQLCFKPPTEKTTEVKDKIKTLIDKMQISQVALKKELAQPISHMIAQTASQGAGTTIESQQLQEAQLLIEELNRILVLEEASSLVKSTFN
jgi:hypothetical protein